MEQLRVSYRREMNHNYMILSDPELQADSYVGKMLSENNIEGLLKFRQKHTEEGDVYCYEITSKQPLSRLLEGRLISYDEIRAILLSAAGMLRRTEEYLLKEEQILLEPDYIYVEPEDFAVFFCLLPGYSQSFPDAFTQLLQYILEKVNHQDHRSVVLAYGLYHESLKENYGMEDLLKYLSGVERGKNRWEMAGASAKEDRKEAWDEWDAPENRERMDRGNRDSSCRSFRDIQREGDGESGNRDGAECQGKSTDIGREHQGKIWKKNREPMFDQISERNESSEVKKRENGFFHPIRPVLGILFLEGLIYLFKGMSGLKNYGVLPLVIVSLLYLVGRVLSVHFKQSETAAEETSTNPSLSQKPSDLFFMEQEREKKPDWGSRESGREECPEACGREKRSIRSRSLKETEPEGKKEFKSGGKERQREQDEWKILFQSFDEGSPDIESSGQKEKQCEKDTQLLNDLASAYEGHRACLESSSKDREDIEIPYVPFLIGKHEEMNDYVLNYPTVSRLHLRVDKKEKVYIFTDMNSTNGTTVNGYKMEANETVSVKEGDTVQIAGLSYRFRES